MDKRIAVPMDPGIQIHIQTSDIPSHVATNIAQATYELVQREFSKPGVWEDYLRWKAARQARKEHDEQTQTTPQADQRGEDRHDPERRDEPQRVSGRRNRPQRNPSDPQGHRRANHYSDRKGVKENA